MALYYYVELKFISIFIIAEACKAFEFCKEHSAFGDHYMYCEYSCCGTRYNRYCCENYSGVVAGAVIGSLIFLGIIIGVILCVLKKKGHRGAVIGPTGVGQTGIQTTQHTAVAFVTSTQIQPNYGQTPPAYGIAPAYQSTYSYQPVPLYAGVYPPPPPAYYPSDHMQPTTVQDDTSQQRDSTSTFPPTAPFGTDSKS